MDFKSFSFFTIALLNEMLQRLRLKSILDRFTSLSTDTTIKKGMSECLNTTKMNYWRKLSK